MLGRLLRPWISLRIEPDAPQRFVDPRPVCYVLEDYGLSNALILDRACRENGMPSPLRPLPGDPLGRQRAYVALSRSEERRVGKECVRTCSFLWSQYLYTNKNIK